MYSYNDPVIGKMRLNEHDDDEFVCEWGSEIVGSVALERFQFPDNTNICTDIREVAVVQFIFIFSMICGRSPFDWINN